MRRRRGFEAICEIIVFFVLLISPVSADKEQAFQTHRNVLGDELKEVLGCDEAMLLSGEYLRSRDMFSCLLWISDIDYEIPIREGLIAAEGQEDKLPYTVSYDEFGEKDICVNIDPDASSEYLQTYIEVKRDKARQLYLEQNTRFANRTLGDSVTYISKYSPCIFANLSIDQIAELLNTEEILRIDYCQSGDFVPLSYCAPFTTSDINNLTSIKIPATKINETKQLYNVSGWNVKVGLMDVGCPTINGVVKNENLDLGNTFDRNHADNVYTVAHTIAPNSTYYASGVYDELEQEHFYEAMEWLLGNNVNVINLSLGETICNVYNTRARWMDHIAFNHDVHIVIAAGNEGEDGVLCPAMANNVITVGNVNDSFTTENTYSSYNDANGTNPDTSYMCKPDIMAPGEYSSDGGTSYSAPMVTGTIALMGNKWPNTRTQQHLVKTALTVGTSLSKRFVTYSSDFREYGSGVLDSRRAFYVINNNRYVALGEVSVTNTTATYTFNVTSTSEIVRIGLTYTNRIKFPTSDHSVGNLPTGNIGNVSLEVYSPSNNYIGSVTHPYANVKLIHIDPALYGTGTYTVKIKLLVGQSGGQVTKFSWGWR